MIAMSANLSAQTPDTNTIVDNMVRAYKENRANIRAYRVSREYQVFGGDQKKAKSEITALIDFLPPREKSFKIEKSTGGMAERVVRKALEKEVELTKTPQVTEMTPANYDFVYVGEQTVSGYHCYAMDITPKKASKDLLVGRIWVDAERFLVRLIEGKPSKSPSFWVKDVKVKLTYADRRGIWVQTSSEATANVRFAGVFNLIARDTQFLTEEQLAQANIDSAKATASRTPRSEKRSFNAGTPALSIP